MDKGVYLFYMCLYLYVCLYRYVLFPLVRACSYLHIFTYSFSSYRGLIRLNFVFRSPLLLHCNMQHILVFLYIQRSSRTNVMKIYT